MKSIIGIVYVYSCRIFESCVSYAVLDGQKQAKGSIDLETIMDIGASTSFVSTTADIGIPWIRNGTRARKLWQKKLMWKFPGEI